jgi:hypothetical protein
MFIEHDTRKQMNIIKKKLFMFFNFFFCFTLRSSIKKKKKKIRYNIISSYKLLNEHYNIYLR